MSAYTVKLEAFEGPLDLLLHLIRKNRYNIFEIPIGEITEQYLAYLDLMMNELNLDIAGAFLVEASNLMQIKTQCLLQREKTKESEATQDPRADLVARLLEHEQYQKAGEQLWQRDLLGRETFKSDPSNNGVYKTKITKIEEKAISEIAATFRSLLERLPKFQPHTVIVERVGLKERISEVFHTISSKGRILMGHLFEGLVKTRREIVVTLLALLELARLKALKLSQPTPEAEIEIEPQNIEQTHDILANAKESDFS